MKPSLGTRRRVPRRILAGAAAALVGGCFLRAAIVNTTYDGISGTAEAAFSGEAAVGACRDDPFSEARSVKCDYFFSDETGLIEHTSTSSLISEFGFFGVLVDPLVLQVPEGVGQFSGTYDDGSGPAPLVVTRTDSFAAQTGVDVVAEAGQTFLIFELPASVAQSLSADPDERRDFSFTANFRIDASEAAPFDVKPMLTVRVDVAESTYYLPQIPCVADFASVPAVTIPVPATDLDLGPILAAAFAGVTGCQNAFYSFFGERLDHFHYVLWKAKSDSKPAATLAATDALGTRNLTVKKAALAGFPADYNQFDPDALASPDHFVAYKAKASPGQSKEAGPKGVQVANLAGTQTLDLKKIDQILLPAALDLTAPIPPLAAPGVNPFVCWRAKFTRGSVRPPKDQQHLVRDALGSSLFTVKKPTRLCLPADVDGSAPGAESTAVALLCFKAKAAKPRPAGRDGIHTSDAIGSQILSAKKPAEVCFPSTFRL